jgi:hypothetical protein
MCDCSWVLSEVILKENNKTVEGDPKCWFSWLHGGLLVFLEGDFNEEL